MDSALPLLKGVIARLKAVSAVTDVADDRIYTDVPQGAEFPYIVVSVGSEPFAAADFSGQAHALRIQCFSQEASIQECLSGRKAALEALDRQESSVTLDQGSLVLLQFSGMADAFIEDDGKTWQSICEMEALIQ